MILFVKKILHKLIPKKKLKKNNTKKLFLLRENNQPDRNALSKEKKQKTATEFPKLIRKSAQYINK